MEKQVISVQPPHNTPPPAVHWVAQATHGREPVEVSSHGWNYVVTGNTLISSQKILEILKLSKRPQDAVSTLYAAYKKDGFFLVALRAQGQANKTIHIMVIEGRLTHKSIAPGLNWFYSGLNGNNLQESDLIRRNILADAYAERNGKQLRVSLGPAANPGGSSLLVYTQPIPNYQMVGGNLLFGNYGSRYSSRYLAGGSIYFHPGMGLELDANFTGGLPGFSKSSLGSRYYQGSVGVSSVTPWGTYGFTSQWVNYRIGDVAAPIYPTGDIVTYSLNGNQLLYANVHSRFSINEGVSRVSNKVTVLDNYYTLTKQEYDYFTLGTSYSQFFKIFGKNAVASLSVNYNQGYSGRHGTLLQDTPGAPTPRFHYLTFNGVYNQSLPWGMSAIFSANGQWSFSTLPQNQQWVLGGFGNLSAYYPGILVGDSGYSTHLTLQSPTYHRLGLGISGSLFFETAGVTSHYLQPRQAPWQSLSDAGLGLQIKTRWGTNISVVGALPVGYNNVSNATRSSNRVDAYFVLQQSF